MCSWILTLSLKSSIFDLTLKLKISNWTSLLPSTKILMSTIKRRKSIKQCDELSKDKNKKKESPLIVFQKCGSSRDDLGWIHKRWIHNKNRSRNHLKMNEDNVFRSVLYINIFLLLMKQRDMNRKLQNLKSERKGLSPKDSRQTLSRAPINKTKNHVVWDMPKKRKGNKCKLDQEQNDSSSIFEIEEILQLTTRFVIEWNELQQWCLFWYH